MKVMNAIATALTLSAFGLSPTIANAAPAYGFINLTVYGFLVTPASPAGATATCTGSITLAPGSINSASFYMPTTNFKFMITNIAPNGSSFSCNVLIPYYYMNVATGSVLFVTYTLTSNTGTSASVTDIAQILTTIPTNYVTTNVSAVAML